jgi:molybdopterin/thiamine biosynthesis adenylyltransferase
MILPPLNLENATISLAGLGGVGGICAQTLVDCKIRKLKAIDFDSYERKNYPCQFFAIPPAIGQAKAAEVSRRLIDNGHTEIEIFHGDVTLPENAERLVKESHIVICAVDNFHAQTSLALAAEKLHIPFALISVVGFTCMYTIYSPGENSFSSQWGRYGHNIDALKSKSTAPKNEMGEIMRRQQLIFAMAIGGFTRQALEQLYNEYCNGNSYNYSNNIGVNFSAPTMALANIFNTLTGKGKSILFPEIGIFNFHTCKTIQAETLMQKIYQLNRVFHKGIDALLEVATH